MRFVLLAEGDLERKALPQFFKRWLDPRLSRSIRIDAYQIQGMGELIHGLPRRSSKHLNDPRRDVIGVVGLFDLHEAALEFPAGVAKPSDRAAWAKQHMEATVNDSRFCQFVAVHETEAWLLSEPRIFPREIARELQKQSVRPEEVNHSEPPGDLLKRLYRDKLNRRYKKVEDGLELFGKVDPTVAYVKCPHLKAMLDEMLRLAREAGL